LKRRIVEMKKLFISLVIVSVIIVIGCSENAITDPTLNESVNKVNPGSDFHGIIPIENLLNDPYPVGNSFYKIIGQIEYRITEKNLDQNPAAVTRDISINLEFNADLQHFCTVCQPLVQDDLWGFISETTDFSIRITQNTVMTLEKRFSIQGSENGMMLNVRLSVSNNKIELITVWLSLSVDNETTES
jgi:hypothetical protein